MGWKHVKYWIVLVSIAILLDGVSSENQEALKRVVEHITYRIPPQIQPISYNLFLHPNLKDMSFSGNVVVKFNVTETLSVITIHSKKLDVTTNGLKSQGKVISIKSSFEHEPLEYWVVEPETVLKTGLYELDLSFSGRLDKRIIGFYGSSYFDETKNEKRQIATSKFEPTYAREAFPCFDEPAMKATFKISLVRPADGGYSALSNMPVQSEEPYGNGLVKTNFENSVPMSTYLTVFIVSDFKYISEKIEVEGFRNFTLRVFSTPAQTKNLKFALEVGSKLIKFYIEYFNIEYPLPKLDMAAIPDFVSGAMETWGLVTYRETNLIYDPKVSSSRDKDAVAGTIAHEFAHMWFGNLVTMKWWSDLFLNEGFATYIKYKGISSVFPDVKIMDQFPCDVTLDVMDLDSTIGSHPIVTNVKTPNQITEIFDTITYDKGSAIIRMLEDFVGVENFRTAVTSYLKAHAYGNTEVSDLLYHISKVVPNLNVSGIMDTWLRQRGYPVINVLRIDDKFYRLTQERFLVDSKEDPQKSPYNYRWSIPITYYTDNDKTVARKWFYTNEREMIIRVPENTKYIKVNKDMVGYYRVNYDTDMWMTLNAALESDITQMSVTDRAHLLDDVFSLASARKLEYSVALEMTKYLKKETSHIPWEVLGNKVRTFRNVLHTDPTTFNMFRNYFRELINNAYESIDWEVRSDQQGHLDNLFRLTVLDLACTLEHKGCLKKAGEEFRKWMKNMDNRPDPDLKTIVYYFGMKSVGTHEDWNKVMNAYQNEQDAQEKSKLQSAMGAIQDRLVLQKYIEIADDENGPIRSQDFFSCISSIARNRNGENLAWGYIRENWQRLIERFGLHERSLGYLIPSVTGRFATQTRLDEMNIFFAKYPDAGAGANSRISAVGTVKQNINWLKENKNSIKQWLVKNLKSNNQ